MATSGSASGNTVPIGGQANNYTWFNWSSSTSGDVSTIYWNAYFHFTSSDAQLLNASVNGNGTVIWTGGKAYQGTFVTRDHLLSSSPSFTVQHDSLGNASFSMSATATPSGGSASTASSSFSLNRVDKSPTTPSISASRVSDGSYTSISYSGGVNNSGPSPSFSLEYYDTSWKSMTLSGGNFYGTPTQAYYFRVISSNSSGSKTTQIGPYYGVASAPTAFSVANSTTVSGKIDLSWALPNNVQNGITGYDVYRDGVMVSSVSSGTLAYSSTSLTRGTSYSHYVVAKTSLGYNNSTSWSRTSTLSKMAPGVPGAPSTVNTPTRLGRNVTVTSPADSEGYGNSVTAYRIQYARSDDNYVSWYSWNGSSDTLNGYNAMSSIPPNSSFLYNTFIPAKTYKFRVQGVNSIGAGDYVVLSSAFFLPASGKRLVDGVWSSTATAKRYNSITSTWVDITTAKRYLDGNWVELS
jgi:hypothetical protein